MTSSALAAKLLADHIQNKRTRFPTVYSVTLPRRSGTEKLISYNADVNTLSRANLRGTLHLRLFYREGKIVTVNGKRAPIKMKKAVCILLIRLAPIWAVRSNGMTANGRGTVLVTGPGSHLTAGCRRSAIKPLKRLSQD